MRLITDLRNRAAHDSRTTRRCLNRLAKWKINRNKNLCLLFAFSLHFFCQSNVINYQNRGYLFVQHILLSYSFPRKILKGANNILSSKKFRKKNVHKFHKRNRLFNFLRANGSIVLKSANGFGLLVRSISFSSLILFFRFAEKHLSTQSLSCLFLDRLTFPTRDVGFHIWNQLGC